MADASTDTLGSLVAAYQDACAKLNCSGLRLLVVKGSQMTGELISKVSGRGVCAGPAFQYKPKGGEHITGAIISGDASDVAWEQCAILASRAGAWLIAKRKISKVPYGWPSSAVWFWFLHDTLAEQHEGSFRGEKFWAYEPFTNSLEVLSKLRIGPLGKDGKKLKKSTAKGDAEEKLRSALIAYHEYNNGSCGKTEPIGVNLLADYAAVAGSTTSEFFKTHFGGHKKYQSLCLRNVSGLIQRLKYLNDEYSADDLFGKTPPGEGCDDEE